MVSYRLLTTASVEIDMMKKQISKKKLERLTIQGGDYRKAGKRESHSMCIADLRALLADDVKNLSRKEHDSAAATAALNADGAGDSSETTTELGGAMSLQRDISDAELDLIMDRERLFRDLELSAEDLSLATDRLPDSSSGGSIICGSGDASLLPLSLSGVGLDDREKRALAEVLSTSDAVAADAAVGGSEWCVPIEGDMYDIVVGCEGESMLASIS